MLITSEYVQNGGRGLVLIKGAPEIVMDMCTSFSVPRAEIETKLLEYQSKGMRTLGFAISESPLSPSGSLPTEGSPMLSTSEYVKSGGRGRLILKKGLSRLRQTLRISLYT